MEADMEERIRLGGVTGGNLGIERKVLSFRGIGGAMRRKPYSSGVIVPRRSFSLFDTPVDE